MSTVGMENGILWSRFMSGIFVAALDLGASVNEWADEKSRCKLETPTGQEATLI